MSKKTIFKPFTLRCGGRLLSYERPAVMGIVNATVDSFYDGGRHATIDAAVRHAIMLDDEGADIIDIGVVSTRPGATLLTPDEEATRLAPLVEAVRKELPHSVISVDTCYSLPARRAIDAGADIINDISGGALDDKMFATVADLAVPYILTHNPLCTADNPAGITSQAGDAKFSLSHFCQHMSRLRDQLYMMGVADVIIDPGFGFSKTLRQNYQMMAEMRDIREIFADSPLLIALSRKSMIYRLLGITPDEALTGTTALHAAALMAGAQMLRVHDVREARQTIAVMTAMQTD